MIQTIRETFGKLRLLPVLAVLLALLMGLQAPAAAIAEGTPLYISEMMVITAANKSEAQSKVAQYAGFQLLGDPLYEGTNGEGKSESSWLIYKTTTDKDDAIVDIKAMHMTGGYDYAEYANYLEQQKAYTAQLVNEMLDAVTEFRSNYKNGKKAAKYANNLFKYYYDDDTEMTLSALFLHKDYDPATDAGKKKLKAALEKIIMQGNLDIVQNVERLLMVACSDTGSGLVAALKKTAAHKSPDSTIYGTAISNLLSTLEDVQNPVSYYELIETEHPYTAEMEEESALEQELAQEYIEENSTDDYIIMYTDALAAVRAGRQDVAACKELIEFESYFNSELNADQQAFWRIGKLYRQVLTETPYPNTTYKTLYELVMAHKIEGGKGIEAFSVTDFDDLMQAMTLGQRAMLRVGFGEVLLTSTIEIGFLNEYLKFLQGEYVSEDVSDEVFEANTLPDSSDAQVSVYEGVDRSVFDPDGIAMTSEAIAYAVNHPENPVAKTTISQRIQKVLKYTSIAAGAVAAVTGIAFIGMSIGLSTSTVALTAAEVSDMAVMTLGGGEEGLIAVTDGVEEAAANGVFTTTRTSFSAGISKAFATVAGKVMAILNVVAIIVLVVCALVYLYSELFAPEGNGKYVAIPRILCSEEENLYNGNLDAKGQPILETCYLYYYGAKNPEIKTTDKDPNENLKKYQIADIYNWGLTGMNREWISVYYTKDARYGEPILAGSLSIDNTTSDASDPGKLTVRYFHDKVCNTMYYYQYMKGDFTSIQSRYLHFRVASADSVNQTTGSVFANGVSWAFGGVGLVLGAAGGVLITLLAKKKRKEIKA